MSSSTDGYAGLAQQAQRIKTEITRVSGDVLRTEATGASSGGLVNATIAGDGRLIGLTIDPSVIDPDDPDYLCEQVIAAVNDAVAALAALRKAKVSNVAEGVADIVATLRAQSGTGVRRREGS